MLFRSENITHPLDIISEGEYRSISSKATSSRPYAIFPLYSFPYITLSLYPVPDAAETLNLESLKPFTESSSFDSVDDTLQMPVNYEEPIIYNLAIRAAPEYGKAIPPSVALVARESYNRLTNRNASNQVEPVRTVLPVNATGGYSINSYTYR